MVELALFRVLSAVCPVFMSIPTKALSDKGIKPGNGSYVSTDTFDKCHLS